MGGSDVSEPVRRPLACQRAESGAGASLSGFSGVKWGWVAGEVGVFRPRSAQTHRSNLYVACLEPQAEQRRPGGLKMENGNVWDAMGCYGKTIPYICNSSPGENGLSALLLKNAGAEANKCLHSIITSVWRLGKAPLDGKTF